MTTINSLMQFYQADIGISMWEIVVDMVHEPSEEKRRFMYDEYMDLHQIHKLYGDHDREGVEKFSWKLCIEKGWLCFQDFGHFKDDIIASGITEEEWRRHLEEAWSDWSKDKIENLLKEYDEYRKLHKKEKQDESKTTDEETAKV